MENLVGMFRDGADINAPYGSWAYAKNILVNNNFKSITNEYGFESVKTFTYPIIGIIPTNKGYVVFTTNNNAKDSIYYIDESNTKNTVVENIDLGFRFDYPIEGVFKFNNLNELIIAWTDFNNEVRVANITDIIANGLTTTLAMFPENYPVLESDSILDNGGNLLSGAYYITYKKITPFGTETQWENLRAPLYITDDAKSVGFNELDGCEAGTPTNKSIQLDITHYGSTIFNKLVVGVVTKIGGILSFYKYDTFSIDSTIPTITVVISDLTNIVESDLDEVLTGKAIYNKAKSIETLNDEIYLANLENQSRIDYQKYANNIKLGWQLSLKDVTDLNNSSKIETSNFNKTFMPREVYNFYIFFYLKKGGTSEYYHIPGPALVAGDRVPSTWTNTGFTTNPKKYEVEDTCTTDIAYDPLDGSAYGTLGKWENQNQVYETNADSEVWDATGQITGTPDEIDFGGQNVRFHKFPSSKYFIDQALDVDLGITKKEVLGLTWWDVYIPDDIKDQISGYGFAYAQRGVNNMTVLGNDYSRFFAVDANTNYNNCGGNMTVTDNTGGSPVVKFTPTRDKLACNCLDLLRTKPSVTPTAIINEYLLDSTFASSIDIRPDAGTPSIVDFTEVINAIGDTTAISLTSTTKALKKINSSKYIPNDIVDIDLNLLHYSKQETLYLELNDTAAVVNSYGTIWGSVGAPLYLGALACAYYSILNLKSDIYQNYKEITNFVNTSTIIDKNTTTGANLFIGDCFTCMASDIQSFTMPDDVTDVKADVHAANIHYIIYNYLLISANNWGLRHVTDDILSAYYPKNDYTDFVAANNPGYYQWLNEYNDDYTSLNNLNIGQAYSSENVIQSVFPYKIAIGKSKGIDSDFSVSWADFLANDYYEMLDRNKGEIWKILKYNEALIIYQKYAMSVATVKDKLITNIQEIYLGTGAIFDRKPNEVAFTNQGYIGNQSQWAVEVCALGVVSLDKNTGKVFIFNGTMDEISNKGLYNFFRDNLQTNKTDVDNPFLYNGLTLTYDSKYKRIIITKKELVPIFSWTTIDETTVPTLNSYVYYQGGYYKITAGDPLADTPYVQTAGMVTAGGHGVLQDWDNTTLFTNNSFTISYSPVLNSGRGGWVCYHDYYPNHLFMDRYNVYAIKNSILGGAIFTMNNPALKGTYFSDTKYPFYFDFIFNTSPEISKVHNVLMWDTDVTAIEDLNQRILEDKTFTHIMVYNANQCSGLIDIKSNNLLRKLKRNTKEKWSFNEFRDMAKAGLPFLDKDRQIISTGMATKKAWYDKNLFLSKYIVARFQHDNVETVEINVNNVSTNLKAIKNEQ